MNLCECCDEIAELGSRSSDLEADVLAVLDVLRSALRCDFKTTSQYWENMKQNVELAGPDGRYGMDEQYILAPDIANALLNVGEIDP